jgi:hypothetical protein
MNGTEPLRVLRLLDKEPATAPLTRTQAHEPGRPQDQCALTRDKRK